MPGIMEERTDRLSGAGQGGTNPLREVSSEKVWTGLIYREWLPVRPSLLAHPFYQAWSAGRVPVDVLAWYAKAYGELLSHMGRWWRHVQEHAPRAMSEPIAHVVSEEEEHVELWRQWQRTLPTTKKAVPAAIQEFREWVETISADPVYLLGVLQAFEVQQIEVARTKMEGLIRWYGYDASDPALQYFREHLNEEKHLLVASRVLEMWRAADGAVMDRFQLGLCEGAVQWYHTLDPFASALPTGMCSARLQ